MITLSDQLKLANVLPLDPRLSNISITGSNVIIESINEYLVRVPEENRFLGMEVFILSPPGTYEINSFINLINTEQIIFLKYHFINGLYDDAFTQMQNLVIDNLNSTSTVDALSANQGRVLKEMLAGFITVETDPVFTAWLNTTPPAYPEDLPTTLAELSSDATHRTVTDTEKTTWNSKADGNHTHTGIYEPANSNIQGHILNTSNPHQTTAAQVGAEPANSNIQTHISALDNPHQTTAAQVGAEPANANIQLHISSTNNPHSVTKTQVGLGNVPNVDATNPSNIIQDSTHRFVTDTEKTTWNSKQNALGYTPENTTNKVITFQATPDNTHYPSEKLVKDALDGKQPVGTYSTDIHSNITALNAVSGVNTGDQDLSGYSLTSHNHDGVYAPALGPDDNYVTDAEKLALHSHSNKTALDAVSGTNTGDNAPNSLYSGLATSKQDTLQSGVNIKTINGQSVVGPGDIVIESGIWSSLTAAYASTVTFTMSGTNKDVGLMELSLFTCTDSIGTTRRIGYIKSATNSSGTITVTVVTSSDLASGDKNFKVAYNRKIKDYQCDVKIPGQCTADTSYSQGWWHQDIEVDSYLLPVDTSVLTAAAGTGAALTYNVYKNTTALFSAAPDMGTNTVLRAQRPTTNTITAGENVSLRIMSAGGATNYAADFQAKLFIVPQSIFTAF